MSFAADFERTNETILEAIPLPEGGESCVRAIDPLVTVNILPAESMTPDPDFLDDIMACGYSIG